MNYIQSWYISGVPIIIAIAMHLYSANKMKETYSEINGALRTRRDLEVIKTAISLNMALAILYILVSAVFFVGNIFFMVTKQITFGAFILHFLVFGLVTLPFGLIGKRHENKLKNLEIYTEDQDIENKYKDYLQQWNKPQWKLQD